MVICDYFLRKEKVIRQDKHCYPLTYNKFINFYKNYILTMIYD